MKSSASDFGRDHGLMHEVIVTGRSVGMGQKEWAILAHNPRMMGKIRAFVHGHASITDVEHTIDCDAKPFVPDGLSVEEPEMKVGLLAFNPSQVKFYLHHLQKSCRRVEGRDLRRHLINKPVLNANVLDFLLANPTLIPEEWKFDERGYVRHIYFWGTVCRDQDGGLFIPYMFWSGISWSWRARSLQDLWCRDEPAALRAA